MLDYKAGVLLKQKGSCGIWVLGSELTICSFRAGGVLGMLEGRQELQHLYFICRIQVILQFSEFQENFLS